jgi:hypothetical protein
VTSCYSTYIANRGAVGAELVRAHRALRQAAGLFNLDDEHVGLLASSAEYGFLGDRQLLP